MLQQFDWTMDGRTLGKSVATLFFLPILFLAGSLVYNIFFHPLRRFPGPLSFRMSRIPYAYKHITGTLAFDILELHKKYGDVVRIAPDELAFSHPDAWRDIMGHPKSGKEFSKAQWFFRAVETSRAHILNADKAEHHRLRRELASGFSEKSMRDQEPLIKSHIDLLMERLRSRCDDDGANPVVLSDWYNFCSFDIIGDLALGETFGCLEGSTYHKWIAGIFQNSRLGTILQMLTFIPGVRTSLQKLLMSRFFKMLLPKSARDGHVEHKAQTRKKMLKRMRDYPGRPDLVEGLISKDEELGLGMDEIISNAEIIIIAGSETTATALSGVTYLLLKNPHAYKRLAEEVRATFKSEDEINVVSVGQLTYMLAVLNEALRMYPPVAGGFPRQTPPGGAQVLDYYIPANTFVAIHQWALYHREDYFFEARKFHPERFLGDPRFKDDRRDAIQPFHVGPRDCLGRNLAYCEMRLILARMVFNFDLQLDPASSDWIQQRNYILWEKRPLKAHLKLARQSKVVD